MSCISFSFGLLCIGGKLETTGLKCPWEPDFKIRRIGELRFEGNIKKRGQ